MEKFSKIENPETCPISELKEEVDRLQNLVEFYEGQQLAFKLFLNSTYGAIANEWFIGNNLDVAEAITLQGQDLNHFSENTVNEFFNGVFQNDVELHKKLGIDSERAKKVVLNGARITKRKPLVGKDYWFLHGTESLVVMGDTDSFTGDTILNVNGRKVTAKEFYDVISSLVNSNKDFYQAMSVADEDNKSIINTKFLNLKTDSINLETNEVEEHNINYVYRHKVEKPIYRIKAKNGQYVEVTNDHSVYVYRDNKIVKVKPTDIKKTDKLVVRKSS